MRALLRNKLHDVVKRYARWYILFPQRRDCMIDKALHSAEPGVTDEKIAAREVIVSLTTYGRRYYEVAATIESIMQGSVRPNRIVLWLAEELRDTPLPVTLRRQQPRGLEIIYCKDLRSYKKIIPALQKFPDADIITIDDDIIYYYDLVENLVTAAEQNPGRIAGARFDRMILGRDGRPLPYRKWIMEYSPESYSPLNFFTGVGGVLYPAHCFDNEVLNEEVFNVICPTADDIWLNAMALRNGTEAVKCFTHERTGADYLANIDIQDEGLFRINAGDLGNANDSQLRAVFDRYNLWNKLTEQ